MAKVTLSPLVKDVRGKIGNNVFSSTRSGATIRERVVPANPRTPGQTRARADFSQASKLYKTLTDAQVAAWQTFANNNPEIDPLSGNSYITTGNTVFVALTSKFLQINPGGSVPLTPPATSFIGDTVTLTATGAAGTVDWIATGSNSANVKTELLVQKLQSQTRRPNAKGYDSRAFVAFTQGTAFQLPLAPGIYALGYRFVDIQTGQSTALVTLPKVTVS